jgi:O-antigen ligase
MGVVIGFAAVALPPLGAFGLVVPFGLVLLWAMPDLPLVYPGFIRKALLFSLVIELCVPDYYMVQLGDLPWISVRRVAAAFLIAPVLLALACSSDVRRRVVERARSSVLIIICAVGYLVMAFLSIPTSTAPMISLSAIIDAILGWYIPFVAVLYVLKDKDDAIFVLKFICFCAIIVTIIGLVEFRLERHFLMDIFPRSMLESLIASNALFDVLVNSGFGFMNGLCRASSVFLVPLSLGEFGAICTSVGLFFALHRQNFFERCLGWTVVISGIVGIFISGSRGGYVGVLASTSVFVILWTIRKAVGQRASLAPAIVGMMGSISICVVAALVLFWQRAHNMVLGGGEQAGSTQARWDQFNAALPLIKQNPITGHGFVTGGSDIGSSIDSYVISLLVETGAPGLVFFAGIVLLPIWYGARAYLTDTSESAALKGVLACSFLAFLMNRLALSERENNALVFSCWASSLC